MWTLLFEEFQRYFRICSISLIGAQCACSCEDAMTERKNKWECEEAKWSRNDNKKKQLRNSVLCCHKDFPESTDTVLPASKLHLQTNLLLLSTPRSSNKTHFHSSNDFSYLQAVFVIFIHFFLNKDTYLFSSVYG